MLQKLEARCLTRSSMNSMKLQRAKNSRSESTEGYIVVRSPIFNSDNTVSGHAGLSLRCSGEAMLERYHRCEFFSHLT